MDIKDILNLVNKHPHQDAHLPYSIEFTDDKSEHSYGQFRDAGININLYGKTIYSNKMIYAESINTYSTKEEVVSMLIDSTIKDIFLQGLKYYVKHPEK